MSLPKQVLTFVILMMSAGIILSVIGWETSEILLTVLSLIAAILLFYLIEFIRKRAMAKNKK